MSDDLVIKSKDKVIVVKVTEINNEALYKAQDLLQQYGLNVKQVGNKLSNWNISMKSKLLDFKVVKLEGRNGGTFLTKRQLMKLAGSVDFHFEDAVYEAFELLREGELLAAAKIADSTQLESKAFSAWLVMEDSTIQQTLKMLGIVRPNFFQSKIKHGKQRDSLVERGILKQRNYGKHGVALRMTAKGKEYLMDNLGSINTKIEKLYQAEKDMVV